jgi:hypothetical protein
MARSIRQAVATDRLDDMLMERAPAAGQVEVSDLTG